MVKYHPFINQKGLEFKCVILIGLNNGILPSELDKNID